MENHENYRVSQGAALTIEVTLRNADGVIETGYDGSQALTTIVWPGGNRLVSLLVSTTWTDPAQGLIAIAIMGNQTASLGPGRYQLLTRLEDADTLIDAYSCTIEVLPSAGTAAAPRTYCDQSWLLRYGRGWLRQLQTDDDETGFAEQLGRARSWIEDLGHAHFRMASMAMVVAGQALGPRRSGARSAWLQQQFDADALMLTDQIREAAAKKALAFICEGQVGVGGAAVAYARLARMYHSQADSLGTCLMLSLDTNGDGTPDVNIDCSCTDPMYG
jgi:hypothetical protein